MPADLKTFKLEDLFKCKTFKADAREGKTFTHSVDWPEIHIVNNFIGGHLRGLAKNEGVYPLPYLKMIEELFGREPNTIEVCSRTVKADGESCGYTVDINPDFHPSKVTDGQTLAGVPSDQFDRWRCDPPYNENTARRMYGTDLPDPYRLLESGSRVVKKGSMLFFLLAEPYPRNYQINVERLGLRRIGLIPLSLVPSFELRACNIFLKIGEGRNGNKGYQDQLGF